MARAPVGSPRQNIFHRYSSYTQGLAAFTALQMKDVPAQFLVFPDENHWVLKGKNSLQWHNTVFDWLGRWLKPNK